MLTQPPFDSPKLWVIFLAWLVPGLVAITLWRRRPRGSRAAWLLVAGCCLVITADKVIDLQMQFYGIGRGVLHFASDHWLDDEARLPLRIGAIGVCLAAGIGALWVLVRRDRRIDRAKGLALAGIAWIVIYVGARLVPGMERYLEHPVDWIAEGLGLLLVWSGTMLGRLREHSQSNPVR